MNERRVLSAEDVQEIEDEYIPVFGGDAGDVCIPLVTLKDMLYSLRFCHEELDKATELISSMGGRMNELVKFIGKVES